MLPGLFVRLVRVRVTMAYAVIVTGVTTALLFLGPQTHDRVIRHASTNLHNLSHGRIATLLDSAFVVDAGPIYLWLPGLMCLMALAELQWGSGRLVVAFAVGHVGATLLVAARADRGDRARLASGVAYPCHRCGYELRRHSGAGFAHRGYPEALATRMDRVVADGGNRRHRSRS